MSAISACDEDVLNLILDPYGFGNAQNQVSTEKLNESLVENNACSEKVRRLEVEGVKLAESGDLIGSIDILTSAINIAPDLASSYNNRAQVLRLMRDNESALTDLDTAINLSSGRGIVAKQAYTQRAMIHQLNGDIEKAKGDYQLACDLGCGFARAQLTAMNPYSALCNQMLTEVIGQLQQPKPTPT